MDNGGDVEMASESGTASVGSVSDLSSVATGSTAPPVSDGGVISSDSLADPAVDGIDVDVDDQSLIDELESDPKSDEADDGVGVSVPVVAGSSAASDTVINASADSAVGSDVVNDVADPVVDDVAPVPVAAAPVSASGPSLYESVSLISEAGKFTGNSPLAGGFVVDASVVSVS